MTAVSITSILASLNALTIAEQLEVNKSLCEMIRNAQKVKKVVSGLQFFPGQIVTFNAKTRGIKNIKIEKFNRAGTAVVGYECDKQGVQTSTMRWTVATTLCKAVSV